MAATGVCTGAAWAIVVAGVCGAADLPAAATCTDVAKSGRGTGIGALAGGETLATRISGLPVSCAVGETEATGAGLAGLALARKMQEQER